MASSTISEPERFSAEMRGYLDWGLKASALRLVEADRVMDTAVHEIGRCFQAVDAIVAPTTPQAAFPFGGNIPDTQGDFCALANMAGCPAISLPMGLSGDGLPLGLQIMAPAGQDQRVLAIASAYEAAAQLTLRPPPPYGPLRPQHGSMIHFGQQEEHRCRRTRACPTRWRPTAGACRRRNPESP